MLFCYTPIRFCYTHILFCYRYLAYDTYIHVLFYSYRYCYTHIDIQHQDQEQQEQEQEKHLQHQEQEDEVEYKEQALKEDNQVYQITDEVVRDNSDNFGGYIIGSNEYAAHDRVPDTMRIVIEDFIKKPLTG